MIILSPIPYIMTGDSNNETLQPKCDGSDLGDWASGLLIQSPAAYTEIYSYLKAVMSDFDQFKNDSTGKESTTMNVHFVAPPNVKLIVNFDDLSDGEKCLFLCSVVLAANKAYGPLFCFWDEPDNYLSLSEVGHFILELQRKFEQGGQLIVTSHNGEAIRKFDDDNTWVLDRKNHLEPTRIRLLEEVEHEGNLINSLICGEL